MLNEEYEKWLDSCKIDDHDIDVLNHDKNPLNRKLDSLNHEFLECTECKSRENLLRIPELFNDIWCQNCASEFEYDD